MPHASFGTTNLLVGWRVRNCNGLMFDKVMMSLSASLWEIPYRNILPFILVPFLLLRSSMERSRRITRCRLDMNLLEKLMLFAISPVFRPILISSPVSGYICDVCKSTKNPHWEVTTRISGIPDWERDRVMMISGTASARASLTSLYAMRASSKWPKDSCFWPASNSIDESPSNTLAWSLRSKMATLRSSAFERTCLAVR